MSKNKEEILLSTNKRNRRYKVDKLFDNYDDKIKLMIRFAQGRSKVHNKYKFGSIIISSLLKALLNEYKTIKLLFKKGKYQSMFAHARTSMEIVAQIQLLAQDRQHFEEDAMKIFFYTKRKEIADIQFLLQLHKDDKLYSSLNQDINKTLESRIAAYQSLDGNGVTAINRLIDNKCKKKNNWPYWYKFCKNAKTISKLLKNLDDDFENLYNVNYETLSLYIHGQELGLYIDSCENDNKCKISAKYGAILTLDIMAILFSKLHKAFSTLYIDYKPLTENFFSKQDKHINTLRTIFSL